MYAIEIAPMNEWVGPPVLAVDPNLGVAIAATLLGVTVAILMLLVLGRWVVWPVFKGIGWLLGGIGTFIGREVRDVFRLIGAVVTSIVFVPLILGTLIIGRWSASGHFGRSLKNELRIAGTCVYRILAANFLTSFGMRDVVAGIEERVPQALAEAPGTDAPRTKSSQFEGYTIVGSLAGGGSGGKLYIAEPDAIKVAGYERNGHFSVGQVVVKSFSLREGSSLPQIVRESRALDAAKKLGLVLDHELTPERFYYVMRYVPGQSLTAVTHQLHATSTPPGMDRGLDDASLKQALGFVADLVATLDAYHRGGLWHKDVKPDNIIVDGRRAHLVDFGLVTPLRSAMTLTTHGTEYFRDPEMVRMALKGVKVHEVDGAKFDIYGAGAVLYSIIENSFPAHGVLSQISMRCPEALRWVVRRAMTEYDKRYPSASAMLRDVEFIRHAADPMTVKPGQLPSMQDGAVVEPEPVLDETIEAVRQAASPVPPPLPPMPPSPLPPPAAPEVAAGGRGAFGNERGSRRAASAGAFAVGAAAGAPAGPQRPEVRITNWLTGAFEVVGAAAAVGAAGDAGLGGAAHRESARERKHHGGVRVSAAEQLRSARARAAAARDRARQRLSSRISMTRSYSNNPNGGTYVAVGVVMTVLLVVFGGVFMRSSITQNQSATIVQQDANGSGEDFSVELGSAPPEAPVSPDAPSIVKSIPAVTKSGGRETPPATSVLDAVAVLVVDLKKPLAESHDKQIRGAVERLERAGFVVRGDFPGATEEQLDLDLTAEAIKAADGLAVEFPQGAGAVGRWLAEQHRADVVVWIKPLAGNGENTVSIKSVVIPRQGADTEQNREGRAAAEAARRAMSR